LKVKPHPHMRSSRLRWYLCYFPFSPVGENCTISLAYIPEGNKIIQFEFRYPQNVHHAKFVVTYQIDYRICP
jgi:hypothetical protein